MVTKQASAKFIGKPRFFFHQSQNSSHVAPVQTEQRRKVEIHRLPVAKVKDDGRAPIEHKIRWHRGQQGL
jgi:hypothetical protein